jgi:hypothetical protein
VSDARATALRGRDGGDHLRPPAELVDVPPLRARVARAGARVLLVALSVAAVVVGLAPIAAWSVYCALGAPGWGKVDGSGRCN